MSGCSLLDKGALGARLRRMPLFHVLRVLLAALLLAAAALKAHQLATEPVANRDLFSYRWSLILQVEFELVLGLWLLVGAYPRQAWAVAMACFAAFAGVSAYKALSGAASCGCFGKMEVSPWYTLALDLYVVGALAVVRPGPQRGRRALGLRLRLAGGATAALVLGAPAAVAMASYQPAALTAGGEVIGDSQLVVLEPEAWPGKRFPLLEHTDIAQRLSHGAWIVMLHRHDCAECPRAIPVLVGLARSLREDGIPVRGAFLELPPHGPTVLPLEPACEVGKVTGAREWFVTTPTIVLLLDGSVEAVAGGKAREMPRALRGMAVRAREWLQSNGRRCDGPTSSGFAARRRSHG